MAAATSREAAAEPGVEDVAPGGDGGASEQSTSEPDRSEANFWIVRAWQGWA